VNAATVRASHPVWTRKMGIAALPGSGGQIKHC
jgi:hypothetical protein